ncbi:MAG: hypothetical protein HC788_08805 [Sphingopyxis sp.]|nr:hypothetical protein [Sphingopyxis sp.]
MAIFQKFSRILPSALLGLGLVTVAAPAQAPSLAMLDTLEKGSWELRERSGGSVVRSFCLGDARAFIQLQHSRGGCSRYVIEDGGAEVTVHYTCPGAGHGRTTIRRETNRLVQIDTQGISGSAPFSFAYEARRTGGC